MPSRFLITLVSIVGALCLPAAASAATVEYDTPGPTPQEAPRGQPTAPDPGPTIAGSPQVDGVLSGSRGTWADDPKPTSEWLRCDVGHSTCETTGDTDLSYTVGPADVGLVIKLRVVGRRRGPLDTTVGTRTVDAQSATITARPEGGSLTPPVNVSPPKITGTLRQGSKLTALPGQWTGSAPITFSYGWFACAARACRSVSTSRTYVPTAADIGQRLVLSVLGRNAAGSGTKTATSRPVPASMTRLAPFPRLVIGGRVAGSTTSISSFEIIRVPRGSTVSTACTGKGCPYRKSKLKTRKSTTVRLPKLERPLRAGLMIVVTVRNGNKIGKYTRLRTRSGAAPSRVDRCVLPGSSKPVACS